MSETSETRGADLLMVGIPGKTLDGASREKLRALSPGALVLRPQNVDADVEDFVKLIRDLHEMLPDALFAVDAEGGRVDTLRAVTGGAPSPAELAAGSPSLAFETGRWLGHALATFDFELALAPVVDLDRGEENNALDGRYLGSDPAAVTTRARAFLRGLHTAGIGGCLKHFPGLGGATDDTHLTGSTVYLPKKELERDLVPFRELAAFAGAVMVGHANYPAYDRDGLPATLSPALLVDLLRGELGFEGVVLSDDLEMQALADWGSVADRAAAAFAAGCDLLLVCHDLDAAAAAAERLDAPEFATLRAQAGGRLARLREDLRALAVRHEQERLDAGVIRGYDFEEVYDKLESLREAAERAAEERAARAEATAAAEHPAAVAVPLELPAAEPVTASPESEAAEAPLAAGRAPGTA